MDASLKQKLADYRPNGEIKQLVQQTPILLLVGPTGAGKDSVKNELLKSDRFHHIVSHTTRPPRINHGVVEQNGREYHFITDVQAEEMLGKHEFIEAKIYSGNLYGTSVAEIQKAHDENKIAMTDIEVQGVAEYKTLSPNVMAIFLLPPDFKTWQDRLQRRYGDVVDANDYRLRLKTALTELKQLLETDYYTPVINDDLLNTVRVIQAVTEATDHHSPDESRALEVARQLEKDIENYLASAA